MIRGTVYPARSMVASEQVMERFGFVEANVLTFEDLYGANFTRRLIADIHAIYLTSSFSTRTKA